MVDLFIYLKLPKGQKYSIPSLLHLLIHQGGCIWHSLLGYTSFQLECPLPNGQCLLTQLLGVLIATAQPVGLLCSVRVSSLDLISCGQGAKHKNYCQVRVESLLKEDLGWADILKSFYQTVFSSLPSKKQLDSIAVFKR